MKKLINLFFLALFAASLTGCRVNVIRLDNRIEKWHSQKEKKKASVESMAKFANKTIHFFLTTIDFQRSREAVVTEAERLAYQQKMCDMQVFLIDYYARRALEAISGEEKDWERAEREWARADSLTYGFLPGYEHTFKLVLIDDGYERLIQDIDFQGELYNRLARDYPGLMDAFRKISEYKFRLAEHLMEQGGRVEALEAYLLVFKRDPENHTRAEKAVKEMTGDSIREIHDRRFTTNVSKEGFFNLRLQLHGMVEEAIARIRAEHGDDALAQYFPQIMTDVSLNFKISPEQATDIYYYTKSEMEGTLPEYIHLWRHEILKGQEASIPSALR